MPGPYVAVARSLTSGGQSSPAATHLGPRQPLVPEVIIVSHAEFLASASAVVAKHLGVGLEDVIDGVQAVHVADLPAVLQGGPFWVEQVPVRIHNQEELFLKGCEGATRLVETREELAVGLGPGGFQRLLEMK